MGFEDLEKIIRALFKNADIPQKSLQKERIRFQALETFSEQKKATPFWKKLFAPRVSTTAFAAVAFLVLFNIAPGNFLSAGEIHPKFGPVEVLRGNDIILVDKAFSLKKGDVIRVGNNSEAEIIFPNKSTSIVKSSTQLKIVKKDSLFLEKGTIESVSEEKGNISTQRGLISSPSQSIYRVLVSESGETHVINLSQENPLTIFDWKDGEMKLLAGEELRLRTDTALVDNDIPDDLKLSLTQVQAIQAKLIITRTKILTGTEKILAGNKREAEKDLASAKKSFQSIVQVLEASRNLQIVKRKYIDNIPLTEVVQRVAEKTNDLALLQEARSVEVLWKLVERNKTNLSFGFEKTGVQAFDRFVLLDYLFSLGTEKEPYFGEILKQKYAISFLQRIQNNELRIDQITLLNKEIEQLPTNELTQDFLQRVANLFPPDLSTMLEEKIESLF
jgi:hypothetical protein